MAGHSAVNPAGNTLVSRVISTPLVARYIESKGLFGMVKGKMVKKRSEHSEYI